MGTWFDKYVPPFPSVRNMITFTDLASAGTSTSTVPPALPASGNTATASAFARRGLHRSRNGFQFGRRGMDGTIYG